MTIDAKTPDLAAVAWRLRTLWEQSSHGNAPLTFEAAKLGLELHRNLEAAQADLAALRAERDRFVARHEQVLAERNQFELDAIALRERLAVAEKALKPFAAVAEHVATTPAMESADGASIGDMGDALCKLITKALDKIHLGHCRAAYKALSVIHGTSAPTPARTPGGNHEAE